MVRPNVLSFSQFVLRNERIGGTGKHRVRTGMTTVVAPFGDSKPLSMCLRLQRAQATQHSVRFDLDSSSFRSAGGKNKAA